MKLLPGVILSDNPILRLIRREAERYAKSIGYELIVTSGMESSRVHGSGSKHYTGEAEDYDTQNADGVTNTFASAELITSETSRTVTATFVGGFGQVGCAAIFR